MDMPLDLFDGTTQLLIYIFLSIPFGYVIKGIPNPQTKKLTCGLVGISMILLLGQRHGIYLLGLGLVNCAVIARVPEISHILSFVLCFSYLLYLHLAVYFQWVAATANADMITMQVVLRLISVSFEVHDISVNNDALQNQPNNVEDNNTSNNKSNNSQIKSEKLHTDKEHGFNLQASRSVGHDTELLLKPSVTDMLMYSFCYIGLVTGPFYTRRTFTDMVSETNAKSIDTFTSLLFIVKRLPLIWITYAICLHYCSIDYLQDDEFYTDHTFFYRLFYVVPGSIANRYRYYFAWYIAEMGCISACLGAYPAASKPKPGRGPTDEEALRQHKATVATENTEYDFQTVHSTSPHDLELTTSMREFIKLWNMTIQYWLSTYVYRRLPMRSRPLKLSITMFMSALWHGVNPTYFVTLLSAVPFLLAGDGLAAVFGSPKSPVMRKIFWIGSWFYHCRCIDFAFVSYKTLSIYIAIRYWSSIYFAAYVCSGIFMVMGVFCAPAKRKPKEM